MDTIRLLDRLLPDAVRKQRLGHKALRALWSLSPAGRKPDFLIVGAQKAGTTFLHNVIGGHPSVKRPVTKEVAFYTYGYSKGLRWYFSHFPKTGPGQLAFESTADYLFHPLVPQRIAETLPDVKVVICLREPVSRAVSHYQHSVAMGFETLDFRDAILSERDRVAAEYEKLQADPDYEARSLMRFSYGEKGKYIDQIRRYEAVMPRDRMLFLNSKEIFSDTNSALAKVEKFLGLPAWIPAAAVAAKNVAKTKATLDEEALAHLAAMYEEPNTELLDHLGWGKAW